MNDYKELIEKLRMAGRLVEQENGGFETYLLTCGKCEEIADAIEQIVKERDEAIKCIDDIETYLQWGAPKYAHKVIEKWRGVTDERT